MLVNTRTALGALPVGGAQVRVQGAGTDVTVYTDASGVSERIRLPAPEKGASLSPDTGVLPYATYDVTVSAPGYYTITSRSVPVFDGIVSVQNVNLIPIAGYGMDKRPEQSLDIKEGVPFPIEGGNGNGR